MVVCVTAEVCEEYRQVLFRDKFRALHETAAALLAALGQRWVVVAGAAEVTAATDPDDNRFLECAEAGLADFLVTGNKRHFPAVWGITRVVNAREFLGHLPGGGTRP